jgi:hypothetical protein
MSTKGKKTARRDVPVPAEPLPPEPIARDTEQLREGLMAWIAETSEQIHHVAAQREAGGSLVGVMSEADAKATARHLTLASEEMFDALAAATQLVVPLFLLDTKGGA